MEKLLLKGKNIKTIEVFNVYGKIIKEIKVSSDKTLIYSNKLAKGIYILKLTTDDKILTTKILPQLKMYYTPPPVRFCKSFIKLKY